MRTDYEQIAASVERLGEERDLLRTELSDTKVERDEGWAKFRALRAAAQTFLEDASMPRCGVCHQKGIKRLVTRGYRGWFACDEHAEEGWPELPHAPALRVLCTLLEGKS